MEKEAVLAASRRDHGCRDLAELEATADSGFQAGRVSALVCCLVSMLSSLLAHTLLYSPWVIYFSFLGSNWLFRYRKLRRRSDLALALVFCAMALLALAGLVLRLLEVRP